MPRLNAAHSVPLRIPSPPFPAADTTNWSEFTPEHAASPELLAEFTTTCAAKSVMVNAAANAKGAVVITKATRSAGAPASVVPWDVVKAVARTVFGHCTSVAAVKGGAPRPISTNTPLPPPPCPTPNRSQRAHPHSLAGKRNGASFTAAQVEAALELQPHLQRDTDQETRQALAQSAKGIQGGAKGNHAAKGGNSNPRAGQLAANAPRAWHKCQRCLATFAAKPTTARPKHYPPGDKYCGLCVGGKNCTGCADC